MEELLNSELHGLEQDRKATKAALESERNRLAKALRGEMGKEMITTLNEPPKKPSKAKQFKNNLGKWFDKILKVC